MLLRQETVYLKTKDGKPYTQVDQWHDRWILDEDGNETDEAESTLVASFRVSFDDEEITKEEYEALLPAWEESVREHEAKILEHSLKIGKSHQRALRNGVKKMKELGLTAKEAEAVAALSREDFEALGLGEGDDDS